VARLTNRLGLQSRGRPEDVLGVKHSRLAYRRQPSAHQDNRCGYDALRWYTLRAVASASTRASTSSREL
jgi:hypothetical protein